MLAVATAPAAARAVVVARSLEPREESLDRLRARAPDRRPARAPARARSPATLLAAAALRPVEAMRRRAAAVTPATPGSRLPVPPARDEISRLAETLNEMLARLEAAFEHERRFVADASHELRTPLALLRTELELALRRPRTREELEDALRSAAEETERLSRLAEDLLLIARADQGPLPDPARAISAAGELLGRRRARFADRAELARQRAPRRGDRRSASTPIRARSSRRSGTSSTTRSRTAAGDGRALRAASGTGSSSCTCSDERPRLPAEFRAARVRPLQPRRRGAQRRRDRARALDRRARSRPRTAAARVPRTAEGGADVWLAIPRGAKGAL